MCFMINKEAKRPRNTIAYKVLQVGQQTGMLFSLYYSAARGTKGRFDYLAADQLEKVPGVQPDWKIGETKELMYPSYAKNDGDLAHEGFYVFATEAQADAWLDRNWGPNGRQHLAVFKVRVNPKDWLASAYDTYDESGMRTYRRLTVIKRLPSKETSNAHSAT